MSKFFFYYYRYRFLILYVFFGVISLLVELILTKFFAHYLSYFIASLLGFMGGIATAFILNIRFNFHISTPKRNRALLYFISISLVSFLFQFWIRNNLLQFNISLDLSRFVISGLFFVFFYFIHRRLTFKDYKKVGVAIYANGVENIQTIYDMIR